MTACSNCRDGIAPPPLSIRAGRAHFLCANCGQDTTIALLFAYQAGLTGYAIRLPGEYMPVPEVKP